MWKGKKRGKNPNVLPMLPSYKLIGDVRSCRHEVLKADENKCRRTGKHSQSRKTPAIQQLSYHMRETLLQTTLLHQQHP